MPLTFLDSAPCRPSSPLSCATAPRFLFLYELFSAVDRRCLLALCLAFTFDDRPSLPVVRVALSVDFFSPFLIVRSPGAWFRFPTLADPVPPSCLRRRRDLADDCARSCPLFAVCLSSFCRPLCFESPPYLHLSGQSGHGITCFLSRIRRLFAVSFSFQEEPDSSVPTVSVLPYLFPFEISLLAVSIWTADLGQDRFFVSFLSLV